MVINLEPYVMLDFSSHRAFSVLPMVVRITSSVLRLPIAKFIDEFGRAHGFLMVTALAVLGLFIQAVARNLATIVLAQLSQGIGFNSVDYVLTIILADMTSLRNRALIYGIYVTPIVVTMFLAPQIAESMQAHFGWRSASGVSASIMTLISLPISVVLFGAQRHSSIADRPRDYNYTTPSSRGRWSRFIVEIDCPGVALAILGLCLTLSSFPYASTAPSDRKSDAISMLVFGLTSLVGFVVWEKRLAPVTCLPWPFMKSRSILGGCLTAVFSMASVQCWSSYYSSYLQVVNCQTSASAGYIASVRPFAFAVAAPFIGLLIRTTGNYRFPALFAVIVLGIPTGLLLGYRGPEFSVHVLSRYQAMIGFCETYLMSCSQMAVMANIHHNDIALGVGIWGMSLSVAFAIVSCFSQAIWTGVVPKVLEDALPADSKNLTTQIYGSLDKQMEYPWGSLIRNAVVAAYLAAQKQMVIAGICCVPVAFACLFMWKDTNVRNRNDREYLGERDVIY
ncbi:major facilitator superfamily transporter [Diaporthe amygdali]|uniref:major facilitator superfamily transporter n=1 Tax=Phomopsis amygdali TaxID=1214568 RepID=UPI0022FE3392|nr:major facilitator superfamily transporter [Diaporthe amygdali]KAJ0104230.1 major facilitator superfamily transporter [Diaporthe amygdali]